MLIDSGQRERSKLPVAVFNSKLPLSNGHPGNHTLKIVPCSHTFEEHEDASTRQTTPLFHSLAMNTTCKNSIHSSTAKNPIRDDINIIDISRYGEPLK